MGLVVYGRIVKMATEIYQINYIYLIDGTEIEVSPLKIKYMREFMNMFESIYKTSNDDEAISILTECARICMKQFYPAIKTVADIEDTMDLPNIYKLIDYAAGVKINDKSEVAVKEQAEESKSGSTWNDLDLVKLESEAFILGIWKNYNELEESICIPELFSIIESKRDLDYQEKKFSAAIQGVDLDKESGSSRGQKEWEDMKARVFSKGKTNDSKDVLALQGQNAKSAGFGIGMGLEYDDFRDPSLMKK